MQPLATPADIEAIWRPLAPAEQTVALGLILQASTTLRLRFRSLGSDIDVLIAADDLLKAAVTSAVANAVKRVLQNPDVARTLSLTTGPYTESKTIDSAISSGLLYFADADLVGVLPRKRNPIRSFRVRAGLG